MVANIQKDVQMNCAVPHKYCPVNHSVEKAGLTQGVHGVSGNTNVRKISRMLKHWVGAIVAPCLLNDWWTYLRKPKEFAKVVQED